MIILFIAFEQFKYWKFQRWLTPEWLVLGPVSSGFYVISFICSKLVEEFPIVSLKLRRQDLLAVAAVGAGVMVFRWGMEARGAQRRRLKQVCLICQPLEHNVIVISVRCPSWIHWFSLNQRMFAAGFNTSGKSNLGIVARAARSALGTAGMATSSSKKKDR